MKTIKSKKDIPSNFNLENYKSLLSMNDKDFFRQLYWRSCNDYSGGTDPEFFIKSGTELVDEDLGDPFSEINFKSEEQNNYESNNNKKYKNEEKSKILPYGYGVAPLKRIELIHLSSLKDEAGYRIGKPVIIGHDEGNEIIDVGEDIVSRMTDSVDAVLNSDEFIHLTVDLTKPNTLLIDDFSRLLDEWRDALGIKKPRNESAKHGWDTIRERVIAYNLIPLLDLRYWASQSGVKIAKSVLAVTLFPDGEYDTIQISQTIEPYLEKIITEESLEKIKREISNKK